MTATTSVYLNHDGGVDDLVSLLLLLAAPSVELLGVGVTPADCYGDPAVSASRKLLGRFSTASVEVALSTARGKNPFPSEWRMHPFYIDALPLLNEFPERMAPLAQVPADEHLTACLRRSSRPVTLVFIGPLTDLATVLRRDPGIAEQIERLLWMGGSFRGAGNVHDPGHDGSAEWNAYWDPEAVAAVWDSTIPVTLFPLLATDQVPLTVQRRLAWAKLRAYVALDFVGQCYALCAPLMYQETNSTYYLWDVLTTSFALWPDLVRTRQLQTRVHTCGPSQGRIEEHADGRSVTVAQEVDAELFFQRIADAFRALSVACQREGGWGV